jgi:hypothetical protein
VFQPVGMKLFWIRERRVISLPFTVQPIPFNWYGP